MRQNDKAWKDFARPVGLTLSWVLAVSFVFFLVWGLVALSSDSKEQNAWDRQCSIAGGEMYEQGSVKLCVIAERIKDYPAYDRSEWELGCNDVGGSHLVENGYYTCFRVTEIEEMEPRP